MAGHLRAAPHNDSAWAHLRALPALPGAPAAALASDPRLRRPCEDALAAHPSCAPALHLLADICAAQAQLLARAAGSGSDSGGRVPQAEAAGAVASRLAATLYRKLIVADPIRTAFYHHRLYSLLAQG